MLDQYSLLEVLPALKFEDAHLLGNGALGATVYGGVPYEQVLINHDTFWSGQERDKVNPGTLEHFNEARRLVLAGKLKEANNLINDTMLGYWSEAYLPLAYLHLDIGHTSDQRSMPQRRVLLNEEPYSNYRRTLALDKAVARIEYDQHGRHYSREMFVSHPDNVLAIRLSSSDSSLGFALSLDSPVRHEQTITADGCNIVGRAPDRVEPYEPHFSPKCAYMNDDASNSLRMAAEARIVETDGDIVTDELRVYVCNASYAVILLAADTNYTGFRQPRDNDAHKVLNHCSDVLDRAACKGYAELYRAHIADYQALYGRVSIDLGESIGAALPTSERLKLQSSLDDPALLGLVAQYTRYLIIASSRPGTQASNLQGIWNPSTTPPWASNYTTNINVEMNYWSAEAFHLSECHAPMSDLIAELAVTGHEAAQSTYGLNGWVAHHNTDLWRMATVAGEDASWAWWAFGGFWMCEHLWQHYEFSQDREYLRNVAYPILIEAARFLVEFVVKDEHGFYVTAPSTSPENKFFIDGSNMRDALGSVNAENRFNANLPDVSAICKISTMDIAIIRELLGNCTRAAELLDMVNPLKAQIEELLSNLYPFKIGRYGQLQEWDEDFEECTPGMGHLSHLYAVYPSNVINATDTPELFQAARKSLMRRMQHGGQRQGWPGAWGICLNARFFQPMLCALISQSMCGNLGANMLSQGSWQIDAISGWGAGIAEMLVQSHEGFIRLLPALPSSWINGRVSGLCARGGFQIDAEWRDGRLTSAVLRSDRGGTCRVKYGSFQCEAFIPAGKSIALDANLSLLSEDR